MVIIKKKILYLFVFSGFLRILLIIFGLIQDNVLQVKYTDIDYEVFTDASSFVYKGMTPYNRSTYRYSPILALLLQPNVFWFKSFGKIIFVICDLLIGFLWVIIICKSDQGKKSGNWNNSNNDLINEEKLILKATKKIFISEVNENKNYKTGSETKVLVAIGNWLLNPFTFTISSRGNSEAFILFFVLLFLFILQNLTTNKNNNDSNNNNNYYYYKIYNNNKTWLIISGLLYGFSIHLKIFPIIYSLFIYFLLNIQDPLNNYNNSCDNYYYDDGYFYKLSKFLKPSKSTILYFFSTFLSLLSLTYVFYYRYGFQFIYETYLYHITRKDIKHNFSPFFLLLYSSSSSSSFSSSSSVSSFSSLFSYYSLFLPNFSFYSSFFSFLSFLPQIILILLTSCYHYKDPFFCSFVLTFIFVSFNKVCTSQYFTWYMLFLPYITMKTKFTFKKAFLIISAWILAQLIWLYNAYLLEFEGVNRFIWIHLSSLLFIYINSLIISCIISNYKRNNFTYNQNFGIKKDD